MHVLSIDSHTSKQLYSTGLLGLQQVLQDVASIEEALDLELPSNLHEELSFRILGYVGRDKPARYVPLYHALPAKVKMSLYTSSVMVEQIFGYSMSRFLTNSRRIASLALFANYVGWPGIDNKSERLRLYTEHAAWLYKGIGSVPPMVEDFCSKFGLPTHEVRKWPVDMLFGSPKYGKKQAGKIEVLDVVNCAAILTYDVVSLSRPTLSTLIEDWRSNK